MDNDLINSQTTGPIIRLTDAERLANFQANSNSIYNKFSPYTTYSIGPSQPFVYTKISDSNLSKNLTKYDTQVAPIGSTVRDAKRIGQYLVTGNGLLFIGKQLLLQQQNAFNETRIYNPLSVLKATLKPGSLGAIDYPKRHLETSGGLLNFFKDALLSTIGFETKDAEKPRIEGTATGVGGVAYSNYVASSGGGRSGLVRLGTAKAASSIFESRWVTSPDQSGTNGGFLANLANALVNKLKSLIPSTNPLGAFGGTPTDTWEFRPEYKAKKDGAYYAFLTDNSGFLKTNPRAVALFYNDRKPSISIDGTAGSYHKYFPQRQDKKETRRWYADDTKITNDNVGLTYTSGNSNNLKSLTKRMTDTIDSFKNEANQFRRSAERYSKVEDSKGVEYRPYKDIPDKTNLKNDKEKFYTDISQMDGAITLDSRMFAKASNFSDISKNGTTSEDTNDAYNTLDVLDGERDFAPSDLIQEDDTDQSKDLIFFYFFDIINNKYIPFRASISSVSDQHSANWEDVEYMGRADKLFLYKGFSRDVSFGFKVYANSAKEMIPMWNRINYLVGLTRPSKYTDSAISTNEISDISTTGRESRFMYPPLITFTMGDLYVDQPCALQSVSINIPDDALWESLRADDYKYVYGKDKKITLSGTKSRQLPTIIDVSVNIKMLEKRPSLGSDAHFGRSDGQGRKWIL